MKKIRHTINRKPLAMKSLGILISLVALFYSFSRVDFPRLSEILSNLYWPLIAVALLTVVISMAMLSIRWQILLGNREICIFSLIKWQFIGYFGNNIFPFRMGEFVRTYFVSKENNLPFALVLSSVALERVCDILVIFLFSIWIYFMGAPRLIDFSSKFYLIFLVLILCFLGAFFFVRRNFKSSFLNKAKSHLHIFWEGLRTLRSSKSLLGCCVISLIIWMIYGIRFFLVIKAFGIDADLLMILILLLGTVLGISLPTAPGAIGTFHFAVIFILNNIYGMDLSLSQGVAIVLHLSSYLPTTIVGFLLILFSKIGISDIYQTSAKTTV